MDETQRANCFMQAHEDLFDNHELRKTIIEAMDLSKLKGRYAGLPSSLKVPATVGHLVLFIGLIMEELEKVQAEIQKIKTPPKVIRPEPPKDRLYRRV
jgi:hypothetical protein